MMKQFRQTLDKFNREVGTIFYFSILRDKYIYLYYTFENQSALYGRFAYATISEWDFFEFDYVADDFKMTLMNSDRHTLEDVLRTGYYRILKNKKLNGD